MAAAGGLILLSWWNACWDGRRFSASMSCCTVPRSRAQLELRRRAGAGDRNRSSNGTGDDTEFAACSGAGPWSGNAAGPVRGGEPGEFFAVTERSSWSHATAAAACEAVFSGGLVQSEPCGSSRASEADWAESERRAVIRGHVIASARPRCAAPGCVDAYLSRSGIARQLGRPPGGWKTMPRRLRIEPKAVGIYCDGRLPANGPNRGGGGRLRPRRDWTPSSPVPL